MDFQPLTAEALWAQTTVYRPDLLKGKIAIVSGGGSGLGRATALLFAKLGAKVAICGRKPEKLQAVVDFAASKGVPLIAQPADIRKPEEIARLFEHTATTFGGEPDILVNNAGGQFPQAAIDFSQRGFAAVVENNLNGTWYMMQTAARRWRDAKKTGGAIVNIVAVVDKGMPQVAHTAASRAGVIALSKSVAVEWAPLGIRINCIAPGVIATEGIEVYPAEARAAFPRSNPMMRAGEPRDVAELCVYLGSETSNFITGDVVTIDGGGRLWGELWTGGKPEYFKF